MTLETIEQAAAGLTRQEKLQLIEHLAHSLRQPDESASESPGTESGVPEKRAMLAMLDDLRRELATLPVANPEDGLSNRDHDRLLYGAGQ